MNNRILSSGEDYLETILKLKNKKTVVRSVDIVAETGYSKSSVSRAVNILKAKSYITIDIDGAIDLTKEGAGRADKVAERHRTLTDYFVLLGVSREIAEKDACKTEHALSDETFEAIRRSIKSIS